MIPKHIMSALFGDRSFQEPSLTTYVNQWMLNILNNEKNDAVLVFGNCSVQIII